VTKRVYLEPPWVMHATHRRLVDCPPEGYEFVVSETLQERVFKGLVRRRPLRFALRSSDSVLPTGLVKSWLERRNTPPRGTVLTYAAEHLVLRPEPWVIEIELASQVLGRHPRHLKRFKTVLERAFSSAFCRKILCQSEASRRGLVADLNAERFENKIEVVPCSLAPKPIQKRYIEGKVRMIFVGASARERSWLAFEYKGGREVLECFVQLRRQFRNLELVVRSNLPPDVRTKYEGVEGLRVIEDIISSEELEEEYMSADICILPCHTTIAMTFLEAMSFELPVVTIDSWANAEYIEHGKTGLVAPRSAHLPYYYANTAQMNFGTPEYDRAMRNTDPVVVDELAKSVRVLVENPGFRRALGKAGRREVEQGRFSLDRVNRKLKTIFDEASRSG
jgi:glycosyltransferase involved in cell wall biosynthesis